ncbi:hypothetical protein C0993_012498, partial [Termitomyces sp. T159_Od127]
MILFAFGLLACSLVSHVATTSSEDRLVKVNVRIESDVSTLYDEDVHTRGHVVKPLSGDDHLCDGTNNNAHPSPVPVATAALDDASMSGSFTWNGLNDYLVNQIGGVPASAAALQNNWFVYLNYTFSEVGGCQLEVKEGDEVLWAFGSSRQIAMRLDGPKEVTVNSFSRFRVTDGSNGNPVANTSVDGSMTDKNGYVELQFQEVGVKELKAEKSGNIRSNTLHVKVIL